MSVSKIILCATVFTSLVLFTSLSTAYDPEGGLDHENETYHADYSVWKESLNWYTQTPDGTYIYSIDDWYGIRPLVSWACWRITCMFVTDVEIPTSWTLQGKTWNEDTEEYENSGTEYVTGYVMEVTGGSEVTETCKKNVIEEYFTNDSTRADNFKGTDQDSEHPDYVEVEMSIAKGMEEIEHTETFGITMTTEEAEHASERGDDVDYGFGDGLGGEGGVGDIYSSVGQGMGDGGSGIQPVFQILFYCLIPLIFILSIMKMIHRLGA